MSEIFYEFVEHISMTKLSLVRNFRSGLMKERAELYAQCVRLKGSPFPNCVGFIDGTAIQIARPVRIREYVTQVISCITA